MAGQIAVPLSPAAPAELLEYYINDSQANLIVTTPEFESKLKDLSAKLKKPLIVTSHQQLVNEETRNVDERSLTESFLDGMFYAKSPAMIVYTSGSTGKPKGVVLSHAQIEAQASSLNSAWNITSTDTLLHALPLNHVHGLINGLFTVFSAGGKIVMLPKFSPSDVWSHLLNINMPQKDLISVFMGVPTGYNYLIQEYDKLFKKDSQMSEYIKTHCQNKLRLMISGSAPLPKTVFQRWKDITSHKLLERYGMTEIGMALSNPLKEDESKKRLPGFVGQPLPNVSVRITRPENNEVLLEAHGKENEELTVNSTLSGETEITGNLLVSGPTVFKEYWNKPEATKKEFTSDGWFITGDLAAFDTLNNSFKILGRNSCDIIKSRGYKISALEMETKLLENQIVEDCAVIAIPDELYGQKIVALIQCRGEAQEQEVLVKAIKEWSEKKFATYSLPSIIQIVNKIPRNQMGKVNKAELVKEFVANLNK